MMDTLPVLYRYSPLHLDPAKGLKKPSLYSHAQSFIRSHSVVIFIVSVMAAFGFGTIVGYGCAFYHNITALPLEQDHRENTTVNASCSDELELDHAKQKLSRCLQTIQAINDSVNQVGNSKEHFHWLKYGIKGALASYYGKNESLIPHHRRRPPVEAWNETIH